MSQNDTPHIYVACLASYNNGFLHGRWIEANQEPEKIWTEIHQMLAESPEPDAEEWAIHDHEGFGGCSMSEYESIERISKLAIAIATHGSAYCAYYDYFGGDGYCDPDDFEGRYLGCYESKEKFAENLWIETGRLHELEKLEIHESYIDWEAVANDLFIDSYLAVETSYNEIHVFIRY